MSMLTELFLYEATLSGGDKRGHPHNSWQVDHSCQEWFGVEKVTAQGLLRGIKEAGGDE